jgi:GTP cyclohydrolase IA
MFDPGKVEKAIKDLLVGLGEDPDRDGLKETPKRVTKMYAQVMNGYDEDPEQHLKLFEDDSDEMVVVKDIPMYSFCEHHMALFHGKMHIAYIPQGKVIGLSKLIRIARVFAKRLQIQERLGKQVADFLVEKLSPLGVAVVIEAEHTCMSLRGVRTPGAVTKTAVLKGAFRDNLETRNEFYSLIGKQ